MAELRKFDVTTVTNVYETYTVRAETPEQAEAIVTYRSRGDHSLDLCSRDSGDNDDEMIADVRAA